jgi:ABC-type Zn uptake system ZnuABC Zn-binding protein ZnuA
MSKHNNYRLINNRYLVIVCITALFAALLFVGSFIFLFPAGPKLSFNNIIDIGNINTEEQEKKTYSIGVANVGLYNLVKIISKNSVIEVVNYGSTTDFNNSAMISKSIINDLTNSRGFISLGNDKWLDRLGEIKLTKLNLDEGIALKDTIIKIQLDFSDVAVVSKEPPIVQDIKDYNYLLSPQYLGQSAALISDFLSEIDPAQKDLYNRNSTELIEKISKIATNYSELKNCANKSLISSADNLSYLTEGFAMDISVIGGFDPINVSSNQQKFLKEFLKSKNSTSLFINKKIPVKEFNELQNSLGVNVYFIDDYNDQDIIQTLNSNLEILKTAQNCPNYSN